MNWMMQNLPTQSKLALRSTTVELILATDMKKHFNVLSQFQVLKTLSPNQASQCKPEIFQLELHGSHPYRLQCSSQHAEPSRAACPSTIVHSICKIKRLRCLSGALYGPGFQALGPALNSAFHMSQSTFKSPSRLSYNSNSKRTAPGLGTAEAATGELRIVTSMASAPPEHKLLALQACTCSHHCL